jgi:hypothetical protein
MSTTDPPSSHSLGKPTNPQISLLPTSEKILEAAQAVACALGKTTPYALVGGAACCVLGSTRATSDVDFVVPRGGIAAARQRLQDKDEWFRVDKRTRHTAFLSDPEVPIEILAPPALFREEFTSDTEVVQVDGINVLKPTLLLNAKCGSILSRATDERKGVDAHDITFLLEWCANNSHLPSEADVPNATKSFVDTFVAVYGAADCWTRAGYDMENGGWRSR